MRSTFEQEAKEHRANGNEHSKNGRENDWPDPGPVKTNLLPVQKLPFEILPEALRPWIKDSAHRMAPDHRISDPCHALVITLDAAQSAAHGSGFQLLDAAATFVCDPSDLVQMYVFFLCVCVFFHLRPAFSLGSLP